MELLFKREQTSARFLKVAFKLWGKVELDEEETALLKRYDFANSRLIEAENPKLIRNAGLLGILAWGVAYGFFGLFLGDKLALFLGLLVGAGAAFWFFNEKREHIFVKDLLHGRHFTCRSIVELAKKEAWLEMQVSYLRQVLESCKHWDGTETIPIPVLPKEEAKQLLLRAG